jgi:hypothetical protein
MLIVRIELHSAITQEVTEIARMEIVNDGKSSRQEIGHYDVRTLAGQEKRALDRRVVQRSARVEEWPRLNKHVWSLVAKALGKMGYGYGHRPAKGGANNAENHGNRRACGLTPWLKTDKGVGVP